MIGTGIVAPIICKYFSFYFRCFSTLISIRRWKIFIENRSIRSRFTFFVTPFSWFAFTGALSLSRSKLWLSFTQTPCQVLKTPKKSLSGTRKLPYENSCTKLRAFCFVFVQLFCFLPKLRNNILGTEYGFSFCARVWVWLGEWGSKSIKNSHSSLREIVWFRDYWRREISWKARFYYPNKKVETYEVLTERDIEIFLVRVCERVWTTELNVKKGTCVEC